MYNEMRHIVDELAEQKGSFIYECPKQIDNKLGRGSISIVKIGIRTHRAMPDDYLVDLLECWKNETFE
jgi:hypothetical protein